MNTLLITLGVLGFGAVVVSAYVFVVAARNYVTDDDLLPLRPSTVQGRERPPVVRSLQDRRSGTPVTFPLIVNGILIENDRRQQPERRRSAAA